MLRAFTRIKELAPGEWFLITRTRDDGAADDIGPEHEPWDWYDQTGPFASFEAAAAALAQSGQRGDDDGR